VSVYTWMNDLGRDAKREEYGAHASLCRELRHVPAYRMNGWRGMRGETLGEAVVDSLHRHHSVFKFLVVVKFEESLRVHNAWAGAPGVDLIKAFSDVGYRPAEWTSLHDDQYGYMLFSMSRDAMMAKMLYEYGPDVSIYKLSEWSTNRWAATVILDDDPDI
jgi:hypothetical protein